MKPISNAINVFNIKYFLLEIKIFIQYILF